MPPKTQTRRKRVLRSEQLKNPTSIKKQRALSPLNNSDKEDSPRTKDKIIAALRQDLAQIKSEAQDAAMLKQQRDFVVHIAASLNTLQGELLEAWHGDVQKLERTKGYRQSINMLNELEDRAVAIEESLKDFPGIEMSLKANVGALEVDAIRGQVEDFKVVMTEREVDGFTDVAASE